MACSTSLITLHRCRNVKVFEYLVEAALILKWRCSGGTAHHQTRLQGVVKHHVLSA